MTLAGRRRVLHLLARALRAERCRARQGHWAYDLARHAALARHARCERADYEALLRAEHARATSRTGETRPTET